MSNGSFNLAPDVDMVHRRISVDRFKMILNRSSQKCDIQQIVNDLDVDGTGQIALDDISSYDKKIKTVDEYPLSLNFNYDE